MTILKKLLTVILCAIMAVPALHCANPLLDYLDKNYPILTKPGTLLGSTLAAAGLPFFLHGRRVKFALSKYPGAALVLVGCASILDSCRFITIDPSQFKIK